MNNQYSSSQTNTMAIVSLISGILSWFAVPLLGAIVAIITGHMARGQIRSSFGSQTGDGMAMIGLILGYLNLIASCVLPILIFGGIVSVSTICGICGIVTEGSNLAPSYFTIPPLPLPLIP